jgi:hypothetical protein
MVVGSNSGAGRYMNMTRLVFLFVDNKLVEQARFKDDISVEDMKRVVAALETQTMLLMFLSGEERKEIRTKIYSEGDITL